LLALKQRPVSAAAIAQKYINVLFVSAGRLLASAHSETLWNAARVISFT
jgi:hypothetical protein